MPGNSGQLAHNPLISFRYGITHIGLAARSDKGAALSVKSFRAGGLRQSTPVRILMTRNILRALALGCVGVALSACNLTASQEQIQAALNPATQNAAGMIAAGTTGPQLQQLAGYVKQARDTAIALCGIEPTVASVANIAAALAGQSAIVAPATKIASVACSALTGGKITATAMETKPAKKPAAKPAEPKEGDPASGTIIVNGQPVVVRGTVVDPSKAK